MDVATFSMNRTSLLQTGKQSKGRQLTLSTGRALSSDSEPTAIVNARWHIQADLLGAAHPAVPPTRIAGCGTLPCALTVRACGYL